ncbi:hypothetical protein MNBD_BACTEROID05-825, partial [hydrothermal vent metagenome]
STGVAQEICPLNGVPLKPKGIVNLDEFRKIAVLESGRVKPLDTYARNVLLRLSGKRSFDKEDAIVWFSRLLFASQETANDKVFLINHPEVAVALGIEPQEKRRYSYSQLRPVTEKLTDLARSSFQIEEESRGIVENEILRVYQNVLLYAQLTYTFNFAFPDPAFTVSTLEIKKLLDMKGPYSQLSFLDVALKANILHEYMATLEKSEFKSWTVAQKEVALLAQKMFEWSMYYQKLPVEIVPSFDPQDESWLSPWDSLSVSLHQESKRKEAVYFAQMMASYWGGKDFKFNLAVKQYNDLIRKRLDSRDKNLLKSIDLEINYNHWAFFFKAKILYLFGFILFLMSLGFWSAPLKKISVFLVGSGFILTAIAVVWRILILNRPPVSNLYDTFIFVALINVLAGLIVEIIVRNGLGTAIASIGGFIFLQIAGKFAIEGDTLQMLMAVLDSNFWLSTHVITITIGYAGVCMAGIVGHIYILIGTFAPQKKELLDSTHKILLGSLAFGLIMTFLGTNLGGIWADSSWGRFWGWDPKENGALLIVLWSAILFHMKVGRMIKGLGLAVGAALGIIVVMWAWFGVNLLGVGLHSYGFTSGLMINLLIYLFCQILFLIIFTPIAQKRLG